MRAQLRVDHERIDLTIAAVSRTRQRIQELEWKVAQGERGAKEDLAIERRTLARLKRQL